MSLAQTLQQSGVVESIARELNIDEQTARTATGALLPAIVAGMGRSSTAGGGSADPLGGLAGAVLGGSAGGLGGGLLDAVLGSKPTPVQSGNDILGSIFGSKDVSRSVAGEVAHVTGLDESLLKRMLPILAMAVMGYLAKQGQQGSSSGSGAGGLGGILGTIASGLGRR